MTEPTFDEPGSRRGYLPHDCPLCDDQRILQGRAHFVAHMAAEHPSQEVAFALLRALEKMAAIQYLVDAMPAHVWAAGSRSDHEMTASYLRCNGVPVPLVALRGLRDVADRDGRPVLVEELDALMADPVARQDAEDGHTLMTPWAWRDMILRFNEVLGADQVRDVVSPPEGD